MSRSDRRSAWPWRKTVGKNRQETTAEPAAPYERLVVGVSSSALFDMRESDAVFRRDGVEAYARYQEANLENTLLPGSAMPFIRRLLNLNDISTSERLVDVVIMSRNSAQTGLRVMRSVQAMGLDIHGACFVEGANPYKYMPAYKMKLFLSAHSKDVREAVDAGYAAGRVLPHEVSDADNDNELRVAFDFDGILADDSSERVYSERGLESFQEHERVNVFNPLNEGLLRPLLESLNRIQAIEDELVERDSSYRRRLKVSMVTARSVPAVERAVRTLESYGARMDEAFFMAGSDKTAILSVLRPHVFFDDQMRHLESAARAVPSVHVPFGIRNLEA